MGRTVLTIVVLSIFYCFTVISLPAQGILEKSDSLKSLLSYTTDPIQRFAIINAHVDNIGLSSGELDSASCLELLQIAQQLRSDSLLAISYDVIGQYLSRVKSDNASGLEFYFKAIPLAAQVKDSRRLSSIYFDIAGVYATLQNNEAYLQYIRKGGENLPDTSHRLYYFMLAQYLRGMMTYFVLSRQPDSALVYTRPLIAVSRRAGSPLYEYNAYYLTAAAYAEDGDRNLAAVYFKKALEEGVLVRSYYSQLRFGITYIPFLLDGHLFAEAKEQAMQLLKTGDESGNNDFKLAAAGFMQQICDSLHQRDSAYYYARMEKKLNQVIYNQENANRIQVLAFNEQIRVLEEAAKAKQAEEGRRQNIQYALIALGIIIFITFFLLLSRTIIVNEKLISFFAVLGLLVVFEFINLLIHPWLARVTHESPLIMLLALVLIAALLIPLHNRLEHIIKDKLVAKNKAIRLASAKRTINQLEKT